MLKITTILLVIATVATVVTCFPEPGAGTEKQCLRDNNISQKEVEDTFPLFTKSDKEVDRKYKCFAKCVLQIFSLRKENGKFDVEEFLKVNQNRKRKEIVTKVTNDCVENFELETDDCEYAFKTLSCIIQGIEVQRKEQNIEEEILKVF